MKEQYYQAPVVEPLGTEPEGLICVSGQYGGNTEDWIPAELSFNN